MPVIQLDRVADESIGDARHQAAAVRLVLDHFRGLVRATSRSSAPDMSVSTSWERQQAFLDYAQSRDPAAVVRVLSGDFSVERAAQPRSDCSSTGRKWRRTHVRERSDRLLRCSRLTAQGIALPRAIAISGFYYTPIASVVQADLCR